MAVKTVFITSGTTYTIPADFGSLVSIEVVGGGGGAGGYTATIVSPLPGQAGGCAGAGGGGYSKSTTTTGLSALGTAYISIGAGGVASSSIPGSTDGGITWFNATSNTQPTLSTQGALANGGIKAEGWTAGAGATTTGAVGTTKYSGGGGTR